MRVHFVLYMQAFDADSPLNELTFSIVSDMPSLGHFEIQYVTRIDFFPFEI